jgi:ATP-binding cassette subfamily B (MDR/TAP) protein 1
MEPIKTGVKNYLLAEGNFEQEASECDLIGQDQQAIDSKSNPSDEIKTAKKGSFLDLFRLLERRDGLVLAFAIFVSCCQGVILPLFSSSFGEMSGSFVNEDTFKDLDKNVGNQFGKMIQLASLMVLSSFIGAFLWNYLSKRQSRKLKTLYFNTLMLQNSSWFDARKTDEMATEFSEQVNNFSILFSQKINFYFILYAQIIGGLITCLIFAPLFTFLILLMFPLILISMSLSSTGYRNQIANKESRIYKIGSLLEESFRMIKTIKILNGEEHAISKISNISNSVDSKRKSLTTKHGIFSGFFVCCVLSVYGLIFVIGMYLVENKFINSKTGASYSLVDIVSVAFTIIPGLMSLSTIGSIEQALEVGKATINKILEITSHVEQENSGSHAPAKVKGEIVFKNVSFSYPSNPNLKVIKNLSLTIKAGQKVGIVGSSGSGKTTIIQLLERFYDITEGEILIDGVDIKEFDIQALRKHIGVVSQEPFLLTDSIYENITLGSSESDKSQQQQVWDVLDKVKGKSFVESLENGLETIVSNGGNNLSVGQKQKISVARILFKCPSIFIFDESTSAFDKWEEKEVHKELEGLVEGSTNIHVAHKIASVIDSDVIYVLHNGELVESGSHANLMEINNGFYKNLVHHQQNELNEETQNNSPQNNSPSFNSPRGEKKSSGLSDLVIVSDLYTRRYSEANSQISLKQIANTFQFFEGKMKLIITSFFVSFFMGGVLPIVGYITAHLVYYLEKINKAQTENPSNDQKSVADDSQSQMYKFIFAQFFIAFILIFFLLAQTIGFDEIIQSFTKKIEEVFLRKLMYTDVEFFDQKNNQPGDLSSMFIRQTQQMYLVFTHNIPLLVQLFSSYVVSIILGLYLSWRVALVSVFLTIVLMIFKIYESKFSSFYQSKNIKIDNVLLSETLGNLKLIRSLNAQSKIIEKFNAGSDSKSKLDTFFPLIAGLIFGFSQLFNYIVYGIIFLMAAKFTVMYDLKLIDTMCAIFTLLFGMNGILIINEHISAIIVISQGFKNLQEKMSYSSQIELDPMNKEHKLILSTMNRPSSVVGKIEFRDVTFKYKGTEKAVFKNFNFIIEPNTSVGVIGKSAVGKSTIIELLLRFYEPQKGSILLDGTKINQIDISYLRSLFGTVRQDSELFNGDIRENIIYNEELSEDLLDKSAKEANVLEFTSRETAGFAKQVGNKGDKMSGGQRQRIKLARIFYRNPRICMFDEPINSLDAKGESIVLEALEKLRRTKTSLTFSSRMKAVNDCDLIYLLEDGQMFVQQEVEESFSEEAAMK